MAQPPKIVRDRLARALVGATPIDHPDANLLAGFVERSLTSTERGLVLGHLAQCAECREQVAVALPKLEAEMTGAGAAVARGWLRWPVLRWGLLVASLAIMGTVALVRQPPARHMELASRANVAPPRATSLPSDVTVGAAPGKTARLPSQQETALPKGKSRGEDLALSPNPALEMNAPTRKQAPQEVQSYQASLTSKVPIAAPVPGETLRIGPNAFNGASSTQPSNAVVAQAAPPPPTAPKSVTPAQGQPAQPAPDLLASPRFKQAEASRASEENKDMAAGETVGGGVETPPPANGSGQHFEPLMAVLKPRQATPAKNVRVPAASAAGLNAGAGNPITAHWSISASGKVQRSRDGGKSWEELDVDRNVVFRVVFAVGPDVWLGGSKGALYHSTDGGQHWTRVTITTGSATVTDDVVHIEFKDAQRGAVGTAGGDTWTTLDAGQHWQKQ